MRHFAFFSTTDSCHMGTYSGDDEAAAKLAMTKDHGIAADYFDSPDLDLHVTEMPCDPACPCNECSCE